MLNSFCVVVSRYNLTLHHERPSDFDAAYKKYNEYISKYFDFEHPYHLFQAGSYSNKLFEERLKVFNGNSNFIIPWLSQIRLTSTQESYTIELLHKSLT